MTQPPTPSAVADKLLRRRARLSIALGLLFVLWQPYGLTHPGHLRAVDAVRLAAWVGWGVVLLVVLLAGGDRRRPPGVRAAMNDEGTRRHRGQAMTSGFWAAVLAALGLYVFNLFAPLDAGLALRSVITAGIGLSVFRFGQLERAALRDG